jgi:hypothetical protein
MPHTKHTENSVLPYGCEALIIATPTILNKLKVIQNQALRLITGPLKSTPLASIQVLTINNLLKLKRGKNGPHII